MAKSQSPLAIAMLEADHRKVEDLFAEYESQKEADDEERRETAEMICRELTVHAQVEEELFYPWLRENLEEEDVEMVAEAEVEHATAKDLIAQIEGAATVDEAYDAKVKVLSEYIKHHVKEEEDEIFPEVKDMGEELDALGQEMTARKVELQAEMGMAPEVPPAGKRGASKGSSARR